MLYLDLMEPDLPLSVALALLYLQLLVYYVAHLCRLVLYQTVFFLSLNLLVIYKNPKLGMQVLSDAGFPSCRISMFSKNSKYFMVD